MSTKRGDVGRIRSQKHKNTKAFKNTLHDLSKKTKQLNGLEIIGVCARCKDIIEWKIKYKKYKMLTVPGKCLKCEQRSVKQAYYKLCLSCSTSAKLCAKCCETNEIVLPVILSTEKDEDLTKRLPERKKRTLLRQTEKKEAPKLASSDIKRFEELKLERKKTEDSDEMIEDSSSGSSCEN